MVFFFFQFCDIENFGKNPNRIYTRKKNPKNPKHPIFWVEKATKFVGGEKKNRKKLVPTPKF
jgi:hypothetical protein